MTATLWPRAMHDLARPVTTSPRPPTCQRVGRAVWGVKEQERCGLWSWGLRNVITSPRPPTSQRVGSAVWGVEEQGKNGINNPHGALGPPTCVGVGDMVLGRVWMSMGAHGRAWTFVLAHPCLVWTTHPSNPFLSCAPCLPFPKAPPMCSP
eukprot:363195-Chlamydomonas_euryale.AAC.7